MRINTPATTSVVILITTFLHQVQSSGVFELRLKSFTNDYGKDNKGNCCSGENPSPTGECSGPCRTQFRVCLKHYQALIDTTSPCTFGDVVTPVLGENSLTIVDSKRGEFTNPISFKFDFTWPGTFSLILEAWHDNNHTSKSSGGSSRTLISRLMTQKWLDPGDEWTEDEQKSTHSSMRYEYRVTCDSYYYGSGCANFCRPRDDHFGHYTCAPSGARVCLTGWKGAYCDQPICLPGCSEAHGHCEKPNQCLCHRGWQGKYCNECERYPGCLHGTCQNQWDCICEEGWGGLFCNQDLNFCTNHKPCRNGGLCLNTGEGSYTCNCMPGFTGRDCEHMLDSCSTHQNPCQNGGTCKDHGKGYTCECPKGFHGNHCEIVTVMCKDVSCLNGGTCVDTQQGYQCWCTSAFTGTKCEVEVDDCNPNPCLNGGTCFDQLNGFQCVCPNGFRGQRCEINIDDCVDVVCLNGGTCVDMIGAHRCQCVPGYLGPKCESRVDYCVAKPCANGATCKNLVNDYQCMCRPGFKGKDCSKEIDECLSSPCKNGGTCINRVNSFECDCPVGFKGRLCEAEVTESGNSNLNMYWRTGNMSKHISERTDDGGLSTEHVVVIATLSTAVPVLVLVSAVVVMCMKQRQKREQQKADDEARMQNEQNTVHSSMSKRGVVGGVGDAHMIKNTWGKSVNNVLAASQIAEDRGGGGGGGGVGVTNIVSVSENVANSELCYAKAGDPVPVYPLPRTRSQKQLNTDTAFNRQSQRASALLVDKYLDASAHRHSHRASSALTTSSKSEKDLDSLCSPGLRADQRISILSIDSSLCNTSETQLVKRPFDKESQSTVSSSTTTTTTTSNSGVYVIGGPGTLATEV